jgi:DNA-binding FrmR family transcriptional regulator
MAHTLRKRTKLVNRLRRLRGQVESVERALNGDADCGQIMQLLAACRGAVNSLLAEVIKDHIREHLVARRPRATEPRAEATDELIDVVQSYFK